MRASLCICLKFFFQILHFWVSNAHDQKAYFVTSSVMTSQKWNLRFQIGQVLQFCEHHISANIFWFNSLGGEVFGSFDFLIAHLRVTRLFTNKTPTPKFSWSQVLLPVLIISYSPKNSKNVCAYRAPTHLLADFYHLFSHVSFFQLFKKPKMESLFFFLELYLGKCIWFFLCRRKQQRELRNCQT